MQIYGFLIKYQKNQSRVPLLLPYFLGLPCTLHLHFRAWSRDFRIHYHFSNSLFPLRGPSWNNHAHREDNFNLQPVRVRRTVNLLRYYASANCIPLSSLTFSFVYSLWKSCVSLPAYLSISNFAIGKSCKR